MNPAADAKDLLNPQSTAPAVELKTMGRREVAVGYSWNAFFNLAAKMVAILAGIVFYRVLGPTQMGIYAVLIPIYQICESFRDAGLALTYIADKTADKKREGEYACLAMLNAAVFAAIIFFARGLIADRFHVPELKWGLQMVALAILLTGISTIPGNKLQKKARFRDAGIADLVSTILSLTVAFVLLLMHFGYAALVWQFIARSFFYTAICWWMEPVRMHWIHHTVIKKIWKQSSHNLFNNVLFTVYTVADNLLITSLFGVKAVGNYNAAYTFGMKPVDFFTSPLGKTLLIAYTRKSGDLKALANVFTRTIAVSLLVMLPLYVLIGVFSRPILMALIGAKYEAAIPLLAVLSIYCGCRSLGLLCGNVLVAMGKPVFNVYGWLLAYFTVGGLLWLNWGHLDLITVVKALIAGASAVYLTNAVAAFAILRPDAENRAKLLRAVGLAGLASVAIIGFAFSPLRAQVGLVASLVVVPILYLAGVGRAYGGSVFACVSKRGLRAIWDGI
jgi:O-antigen/teichoic acid export membrane protein